TAAMATQTITCSPPQSTPSGKRSTANASRRTAAFPARVAWGIATPSPTYVEIERSRSSIASTYVGSTAPIETRVCPHWRMASSRSVAAQARWIARSSSRPTNGCVSAIQVGPVLHRGDDRVDPGVPDEHLDRDDHLVRCADPGPLGHSLVD